MHDEGVALTEIEAAHAILLSADTAPRTSGSFPILATVVMTPGDLGNTEAVLAEVYCWEFPTAYRQALEQESSGM